MSDWQDISTAPKDGTRVLLYVVMRDDDPYVVEVGEKGWAYADIGSWFDCEWLSERYAGNPTHWMPLPASPIPVGAGRPPRISTAGERT